jgi:hypothetical protein
VILSKNPYKRAKWLVISVTVALATGIVLDLVTDKPGIFFVVWVIMLLHIVALLLTVCPDCRKRVMSSYGGPGLLGFRRIWPERVCSKCGLNFAGPDQ